MTILICTGFYIYVIFSVNVYRKEIELESTVSSEDLGAFVFGGISRQYFSVSVHGK